MGRAEGRVGLWSSYAIVALTILGAWGGILAIYVGKPQDIDLPELVAIDPGDFQYRSSGEFLKNGFPVDAPKIVVRFSRPLHIMKFQISNNDYGRCVTESACGPPFKKAGPDDDEKPVTGVSFIDAENYARWLSAKTGVLWRLPSDEEWAYSAGSRFFDDALGETGDPNDPVARSLAKYKLDAERNEEADPVVKPKGFYGVNQHGVYDQSGNVWEWTSTCYKRSKISGAGEVNRSDGENCGVRVIEGKHRTYLSDFIQDAKGGGCSVGTPPDHIGFRLVREGSVARNSN